MGGIFTLSFNYLSYYANSPKMNKKKFKKIDHYYFKNTLCVDIFAMWKECFLSP